MNRPSLVIVPGAGLDSVRAIVQRDLDFSDRFTMLGDFAATDPGGSDGQGGSLNYGLYKNFGAAFGVELGGGGRRHGAPARHRRSKVINTMTFPLPAETDAEYRMQVHRATDEVVRWVTRHPGRRRHAFRVRRRRPHHADRLRRRSGGRSRRRARPRCRRPGRRRTTIAYTRLARAKGPVLIQRLSGGTAQVVPGSQSGAQHHADVLARRAVPRVCAVGRAGHQYLQVANVGTCAACSG